MLSTSSRAFFVGFLDVFGGIGDVERPRLFGRRSVKPMVTTKLVFNSFRIQVGTETKQILRDATRKG